jgi:hypothetical protein
MNTFLPASTTRMTTEQLIHACAEQGVTVTVTQLARWVREGLIPSVLWQRHGLGRGSGTQWLWEAECLPRAVIIGRSLSNDRSLLRAARPLAEVGYAPSPLVLKDVLLDCVEAYQRLMTTRQTYIGSDHSQEEQYRRLRQHMRRKTPDMPDAAFDPFLASVAAFIGVLPNDARVSENMQQLQQIVSVPSLKERLETIDGSSLLVKYESAGLLIPSFIPLIVGLFNEFFSPFVKQLQEKKGQDTTVSLPALDLQKLQEYIQIEGERVIIDNLGLGRLRLYLTILFVALPSDEERLAQWAATLLGAASGILRYFGFSPNLFSNLLEASKNNASG